MVDCCPQPLQSQGPESVRKKRVLFENPAYLDQPRPRASLTLLTLLGVSYTACISGGYGLEESVSAGGPLLTIVFLCIIPILWGVPVSLCVAELSCAIRSNAGPIMWVNVAFQPWFCFCTVICTAVLNFVDNSLYPTVLADYMAKLWDLNFAEKSALKVSFLCICTLVNISGVHVVGVLSVGMMAVTLMPFLLLFVLQIPEGFDWQRISTVPERVNWSVFLPVVAWNFSGFEGAGNVIEEVENPKKTFICALFLLIFCALATYIPPVIVGASAEAIKNTPFEEWDTGFLIRVGEAVGGYRLALFVTIGGAVSTFGLMTTQLTTTSRSLAGMGTLNAFPLISNWLSRYNSRSGTPVQAICTNAVITCILSICFTFTTLVELDQIFYSLRLIAILLSFLRLRQTQPDLERPYCVPGGRVGALICGIVPIIFSAVLIFTSIAGSTGLLFTTIGVVGGTIMMSILWVHFLRPNGFEGQLVEYEDSDLCSYGSAT
ncbi:putative Amino acid permease [Trypanosoma vivax]|nr:amino acid transporter [Trypanosoma vivax]KAH8604319.1 putative Amino acid permease [Trypanosoma vivax]